MCGSRLHVPTCDTPYLPTEPRSGDSEWVSDQKSFSNFFFIFLKWSSAKMFFFVFGKIRISIFPIGKKSTFVPKIGGKFSKKICSNFFFLFFKMKLRKSYFFLIWNILNSDFSNWKKVKFSFSKNIKRFPAKNFLAGISFINWAERIYKGFLL